MTDKRKPASFRVAPQPAPDAPHATMPRAPRAVPATSGAVIPSEFDVFDETEVLDAPPPPATPARRGSLLRRTFATAAGALLSLALWMWIDALVRALFERAEWLGWAGIAAAGVAAAALLLILLREAFALARLASVERLRAQGSAAWEGDDASAARSVLDELAGLLASRPETAAGRRAVAELAGEVIDGRDLIGIAERELLAPLDARAKVLVLDAAKRVSLVTAVSPRALVDIAYVVFEAGRLMRRISELYGGRAGTLGFFRLARNVLAHLAVTGSIAAGDSIVQQIVGHGLAARLSAKLGEGIVNGMMTARIGIAVIDTARPLPFRATKQPGLSDFLAALTSFARSQNGPQQGDGR